MDIEASYLNAKEILRRLIEFETTSDLSNLELIEYIEGLLRVHPNVTMWRFAYPKDADIYTNLLFRVGPKDPDGISPQSPRGILVEGHIDTVPARDQATWTRPRYELTESEDGQRLYGRGTVDMKGFIACVLSKVPSWANADLSEPIVGLISYDEERGCRGIGAAIDQFSGLGINPRLGIIGEPTGLEVVYGNKSCVTGNFTFGTGTGHTALGESPEITNALQLGFQIGNAVANNLDLRDSLGHPLMGRASAEFSTFTQLDGGGNVIPSTVKASFDLRGTPGITEDMLRDAFSPVVARALADYRQRKTGIATVDLSFNIRGSGFLCDDPTVIDFGKLLAQTSKAIVVDFNTEASRFYERGYPKVVVCGPGDIKQAHKPDEYVTKNQLIGCLAMLDRIGNFCANPSLG